MNTHGTRKVRAIPTTETTRVNPLHWRRNQEMPAKRVTPIELKLMRRVRTRTCFVVLTISMTIKNGKMCEILHDFVLMLYAKAQE